MRLLLITANVGSLFEEEQKLHSAWTDTLVQTLESEKPDVAVIHTQETGGKEFEQCAPQVRPFIEELTSRLTEYPICRAYMDIDYDNQDSFTGLGQLVLIRRGFNDVTQYDFKDKKFFSLKEGLQLDTHGLDCSSTLVKLKFPKNFRHGRWGRKGYMHSRFKIANRIFDFVNVHLFHDESNIALVHENPTIYSAYRKKALNYVLEQLKEQENGIVPLLFVFGDFNFRLHYPSFLDKLTEKSKKHTIDDDEESKDPHGSLGHGLEGQTHLQPETIRRSVSAIEFRRDSKVHELEKGCVLRIEKKRFDYFDHQQLLNEWKDYLEDDQETEEFNELNEFPIEFPPTYPWSEDPDNPESLMKTRAPAWCDRVLMNETAFSAAKVGSPRYDSIGKTTCIGDHKPVVLSFSV